MAEQKWECGTCKKSGVVSHGECADVMSVSFLIDDAHHRVSPNCKRPASLIRTISRHVAKKALPIGITPLKLWQEKITHARKLEILYAMKRYSHVGMVIPINWIEELQNRIS